MISIDKCSCPTLEKLILCPFCRMITMHLFWSKFILLKYHFHKFFENLFHERMLILSKVLYSSMGWCRGFSSWCYSDVLHLLHLIYNETNVIIHKIIIILFISTWILAIFNYDIFSRILISSLCFGVSLYHFGSRVIMIFKLYFWDINIITFLYSISSHQILSSTPPWLIFSIIFIVSISVYLTILTIFIYLYIYIPKYKLLILYHVTYMYIFRADLLVSGDQLECSSLGKTMIPLSAFLCSCSYFCWVEVLWALPPTISTLSCLLLFSLFSSH